MLRSFALALVVLVSGCGGRADATEGAGGAGAPNAQPIAGAPGTCVARAGVASDVKGTRVAVAVVAADETDAYWIRSGPDSASAAQIVRASRAGGAVTVLASGVDAQGIAVDEAFAYWVQRDGVVMRVPKAGGAPTEIVPKEARYRFSDGEGAHATASSAFGLVREGSDLFWVASLSIPGHWVGAILRVPTSGGDVSVVASDLPSPLALTVDATHAYWVEGGAVRDSEPGLFKVDRRRGDPSIEQLATGETFRNVRGGADARFSLVHDDTALYWLSRHDAAVVRIDKAGGRPTPIATDVGDGVALAAGDGAVYFSRQRGAVGSVSRVATTGGPITSLFDARAASLAFGPGGLVVLGDGEISVVTGCR